MRIEQLACVLPVILLLDLSLNRFCKAIHAQTPLRISSNSIKNGKIGLHQPDRRVH